MTVMTFNISSARAKRNRLDSRRITPVRTDASPFSIEINTCDPERIRELKQYKVFRFLLMLLKEFVTAERLPVCCIVNNAENKNGDMVHGFEGVPVPGGKLLVRHFCLVRNG